MSPFYTCRARQVYLIKSTLSFDQLFCQLHVVNTSTRIRIVQYRRNTMTGSFAQPDIPLNNGSKHHIPEMLFQFLINLIGKSQPRIVHSQQKALYFQSRIQFGFDNLNCVQQFTDSFQRKIFGLNRNNNRIRSG